MVFLQILDFPFHKFEHEIIGVPWAFKVGVTFWAWWSAEFHGGNYIQCNVGVTSSVSCINFPTDFPIFPWIFRFSHEFSRGFFRDPREPREASRRFEPRPSTLGVKRWAQPAWRRQGSILGYIIMVPMDWTKISYIQIGDICDWTMDIFRMMVFDGFWWLMMVNDGKWWLMVIHGG